MILRSQRIVRSTLITVLLATVTACAGSHRDLSTIEDPAVFVPVVADHGVDIYVDQIDGEDTSFAELDRVSIDPGIHEISVRLEYQPTAGSSLVVGGLANLLLRAGTNKTIRTTLTVEVAAGNVYRLTAKVNSEGGLDFVVLNETTDEEALRQSFSVQDGSLERLF